MIDQVLNICRKLVKIDNRPDVELAKATGLCKSTIYRLRNGDDTEFVRSSTVSKIATAMHRTVILK